VTELLKHLQSLQCLRQVVDDMGLDGIVAMRLDLPYRPGERAMQRYKLWQTVDCVSWRLSC
jgi:ATP-dependent DNA ligase